MIFSMAFYFSFILETGVFSWKKKINFQFLFFLTILFLVLHDFWSTQTHTHVHAHTQTCLSSFFLNRVHIFLSLSSSTTLHLPPDLHKSGGIFNIFIPNCRRVTQGRMDREHSSAAACLNLVMASSNKVSANPS